VFYVCVICILYGSEATIPSCGIISQWVKKHSEKMTENVTGMDLL